MKKIVLLIVIIALSLLLFVSCGKKKTEQSPSDPGNTGALNGCEHAWTLTAFVTEETNIPFAGKFLCSKCEKEEIRSISYTDIEIPLIEATGDVSFIYEGKETLSKANKAEVSFSYQSAELTFTTPGTFAYQGKSTSDDPKKNYSVNLLDVEGDKKREVTFRESWGAGSKYVLKANYIDPSAARNIVMASLYGQIAHSVNLADPFASLVNGGAVDGYPVLFYLNGVYQGLYNWNIRKDEWLYGMGNEGKGEAVICGSDVSELESENGITIPEEGQRSAKSWKYEYVNEAYGEEGWALASFNEMLFAIKNAGDASIRAVIAENTVLQRALDVVLFAVLFGAADNISGNQVWCTYDAKKWTPVSYDLDRTLGRNGEPMLEPDESLTEPLSNNLLYQRIFYAYFEEIKARYLQLRSDILTTENVMSLFDIKLRGVDDRYFAAELEKWQEADWRFSENASEIVGLQSELDFIRSYLDERFAFCDDFFEQGLAA